MKTPRTQIVVVPVNIVGKSPQKAKEYVDEVVSLFEVVLSNKIIGVPYEGNHGEFRFPETLTIKL